MNNRITPGEIVVMAAGGVALIASFLPFYSIENPFDGGDESFNAWSGDIPVLFPVATLIAIAAIAAAVLVALNKFANMDLSAGILGFGFVQLLMLLGFFSTLVALAYLLQDKGTFDTGFGYWLMLLSAIASLVGAILMRNERAATAGPGPGTV